MKWVRAHREILGRADCETRCDIRGNALADELAKKAALRHDEMTAALKSGVEWHIARTRHVVRAIATALALFPPAPGDMERIPRRDRAGRNRARLWRRRL